jgi:hypothetical protein
VAGASWWPEPPAGLGSLVPTFLPIPGAGGLSLVAVAVVAGARRERRCWEFVVGAAKGRVGLCDAATWGAEVCPAGEVARGEEFDSAEVARYARGVEEGDGAEVRGGRRGVGGCPCGGGATTDGVTDGGGDEVEGGGGAGNGEGRWRVGGPGGLARQRGGSDGNGRGGGDGPCSGGDNGGGGTSGGDGGGDRGCGLLGSRATAAFAGGACRVVRPL